MKKLISILVSMLLVLSLTVTGLAADGTFQGEGAGKGGMITVEVTVENGEIAAINVLSHDETPGFADALGTVSAAMIAANQVDVDGVTGATLSSNGLKAAVTAALAAAGITVAVSNLFGSTPFSINYKGCILAVILWVLTNKVKKTKSLHPIVFIGASALVGILFSMG